MRIPRTLHAARALTPLVVALAACGTNGRMPDVQQIFEDPTVLPDNVPPGDGTTPDGSMPDMGVIRDASDEGVIPVGDAGDGGPVGDGGDAGGDAGPVPVGECAVVGSVQEIFREPAASSRELYVAPLGATGYAVGGSWAREILTQTRVALLDDMGRAGPNIQVSNVPRGTVTGGSLWADGANGLVFSMAWNGSGSGQEVYAQRAAADGTARGEPVLIVDDPEVSSQPKIVRVGSNYLVAWRSTNEMTRRVNIRVAGLSSTFEPMTSMAASMDGAMVNNFDLVADGDRAVLAYVSNLTIRTIFFGADTRQVGTEAVIPGGGTIMGNVALAMRGNVAAAFWVESVAGVWLHGARIDVVARVANPQVNYGEAGTGLSSVGATVDTENGFAVFFRSSSMMSGAIAMLRTTSTLTGRSRVSFLARSPGGAQVRAASRGDGLFGVSWIDAESSPMMAVGRAAVARCP